ncbi:MAG: restriction endonuclease [Sandaracinaceae bacterium]|nr:restriction endonuclease [Sandaracinaceae bacterium]
MTTPTTWMVRAGRGGDQVDAFLADGVVGIGYGASEFKGLPPTLTREAIVAGMKAANPHWSTAKLAVISGQLVRFVTEIKAGDRIVTGDPETRTYFVGRASGELRWEGGKPLPIRRGVKWTGRVARDALSVSTLNTLGAIQTLFRISDEVADELVKFERPITEEAPPPAPKAEQTAPADVVPADLLGAPERAKSFIDDMINRLDWDELQDLVAGVLRAMGYKTRVSTPGPDRGVDIFASPDGLGLQEPRIFVEVKHRQAAMGAPDLRTFLGGRKAGDKCLYVSTGGFKKDAHYEADRSTIPITLVTLPVLRDLLLEHYERLDEETRALVPLRRVYLPFDPND